MQVPHQPDPRQGAQHIVGHVAFPPAKPLPHRRLVGVMIVVPALAQGQQRQQPVVARLIAGDVAPPADQVGQRVDAECRVPQRHRAPAEADDQSGPARDRPARHAEQDRRQVGMPIEPSQLLVSAQVADGFVVGHLVAGHEDPADMRVEEAAHDRRMHVGLGVRVSVVPAVHGGPPQRSALGRGLCHEGEAELQDPARPERAMREIAVIARPDGEDAHQIEQQAEHHRGGGHPAPEHAETAQMDQQKSAAGGVRDVVGVVVPRRAHGAVLMGQFPW